MCVCVCVCVCVCGWVSGCVCVGVGVWELMSDRVSKTKACCRTVCQMPCYQLIQNEVNFKHHS